MVARVSFFSLLRSCLGGPQKTAPAQLPSEQIQEFPASENHLTGTRRDFLHIPIRDICPDRQACETTRNHGQFLVRQDRWAQLSQEMQKTDQNGEKTPGGKPLADLLALGARADMVNTFERVIEDGFDSELGSLTLVLEDLERLAQDCADDPYLTAVLALTHLDAANIWRGRYWDTVLPRHNRNNSRAHVSTALSLIERHAGLAKQSPLIAAARCRILAASDMRATALAAEYENLIDLDPDNHRPMRSLGLQLLPRKYGPRAYEALDREARRLMVRNRQYWGNAAYSWVYFDTIAKDEGAAAHVDVALFIDGLHAILAKRPDQQMVNLIAAYCSIALRARIGLDAHADLARTRIADCANWVVRDHLHEIHPLIWAHASEMFDRGMQISSPSRFAARGRNDALRTLCDLFRDDIDRGVQVTFTPNGLSLAHS